MEEIGTAAFRVEVRRQESYSRLQLLARTFFGPFYLVLPHGLYLGVLGLVAAFYHLYGAFAVLITGTLPEGMHKFLSRFLRYASLVHLRVFHLADGYPSFRLDAPDESMEWHLPYNPHPDRLSVLLRLLFAPIFVMLPHMLIWSVRNFINGILAVVAFWVVLFTGTYPERLFDFQVGTLRWLLRVYVYAFLLSDTYPPFSGKP